MISLVISLVSGSLSLVSLFVGFYKPTKRRKRISVSIAIVLFFTAAASGVLTYMDNRKTEARIVGTEDQIVEIRTPRRMEPETKRMFAARLNLYAGQKFDMQVFRDHDSLELARDIHGILEEVGWVRTKVYPRRPREHYAETSDAGVQLVLGEVAERRTTAAMIALQSVLNEAGLYDDSTALTPVSCVEVDGLPQVGSKVRPIPCSESFVKSMEIEFTIHDKVIPDDTLVVRIGRNRP